MAPGAHTVPKMTVGSHRSGMPSESYGIFTGGDSVSFDGEDGKDFQ